MIPQDFSAAELFNDRQKLIPYRDAILRISELEEKVLTLI